MEKELINKEKISNELAEEIKQAVREYFSVSKGKFDAYAVAFCLEQGKYMNELLHYIDFVTFKEGVSIWKKEQDKGQTISLEHLENSWDKKYALYFAYIKMVVLERKLAREKKKVMPVLLEYAEAMVSYVSLYYAKSLLQEENWCVLPRDCRFALCVKKAFEAKENGCRAEWTEYMKKAAKVYPVKISILQSVLKEEAEQVALAQMSLEMKQLAADIKLKSHVLLLAGKRKEAMELLLELEQCVPKDSEISRLKQRIIEGK